LGDDRAAQVGNVQAGTAQVGAAQDGGWSAS
jgi:hypothetical protein